jgi:putative acetyltransferase
MGPVSVLPQYQRREVGSRLIRETLRLLRERGACGCVVLGEPDYYRRFGFQADHDLVLPSVPSEYFQALSFDSSKPHGLVTYHEAFNAQS